jgi:ATP-dependent Clp protease ATP-binding subunit ClpA
MPKINVYLPDDLAEAVRDTALPVSAICQRALEQAVGRMTTIRTATLGSIRTDDLAARFPNVTARAATVLRLAAEQALADSSPTVDTGHLLRGMGAEGGNLGVTLLHTMEIDAGGLPLPDLVEAGGAGDGLHFSTPAGNVLELAVNEAIGFGHNYVGCEHFLIALVAESDGRAGKALRAAGLDAKAARRAVGAALAGFTHGRASTSTAGLLTAVRAELQPLIARIERLEQSVH